MPVVYLLMRCLLGCLMVLTRHQMSKDAELHWTRAYPPFCSLLSLALVSSKGVQNELLCAAEGDPCDPLIVMRVRQPVRFAVPVLVVRVAIRVGLFREHDDD